MLQGNHYSYPNRNLLTAINHEGFEQNWDQLHREPHLDGKWATPGRPSRCL